MVIQYDDGSYGPTKPAAEISEELRQHFMGEARLPKDPVRAIFADTTEAVEAEKHRMNGLAILEEKVEAIQDRLEHLEAKRKSIIVEPTVHELRQFAPPDG